MLSCDILQIFRSDPIIHDDILDRILLGWTSSSSLGVATTPSGSTGTATNLANISWSGAIDRGTPIPRSVSVVANVSGSVATGVTPIPRHIVAAVAGFAEGWRFLLTALPPGARKLVSGCGDGWFITVPGWGSDTRWEWGLKNTFWGSFENFCSRN